MKPVEESSHTVMVGACRGREREREPGLPVCASDEDESRVLYEETFGSDVQGSAAQVATMRPCAKTHSALQHSQTQRIIIFFCIIAFHITKKGGMNIGLC